MPLSGVPMRTIILSDVHLAPKGPLNVFADGQAMVGFLRYLKAEKQPTELLLGGDFFDFLQCPEYSGFDAQKAPDRLRAILDDNEDVSNALKDFASAANHEVTILTGNHDPEIGLKPVREVFEEAIGRKGSVGYEEELFPEGKSERSVWGRCLAKNHIWVAHGDRWDSNNAIDRTSLFQGDQSRFVLPKGSHLVFEVLSEIQLKHPWVYQLKPELDSVVPLLWYLDRDLTWRYLTKHFGLTRQMLRGYLEDRVRAFGLLGEDASQAARQDSVSHDGEPLTAALVETLAEMPARDQDVLLAEIPEWQSSPQTDGPDVLAAHDGMGRFLLRTWLRLVRFSERFLDMDGPDATPDLAARHLPAGLRTFIAGHTHGPRSLPLRRPAYYNSGTWVPVGRLPSGDIRRVIDELDAPQRRWSITVPRSFVSVSEGGKQVSLCFCDPTGCPIGGIPREQESGC